MRLRFLGTGPAGGLSRPGRSGRAESSLLVSSADSHILIDATRFFAEQARRISQLDLVLITHAHRDACGGVPALDRWLAGPVPLYSARATVRVLRERHRLARLELRGIAPSVPVEWRDWTIVALVVPHSPDCTTLAWRIERAGVSLVYASDVARLTPGLATLCRGCDLLVLDGATWQRRIFTHLEIRSSAPVVARWPVGRIVLTQLGRSTPPHAQLARWLEAVDPRLGAAYDGMELVIRRRARARIT